MIYVATQVGLHHEISEDAVVVGNIVLTETTEKLEMPESGFICVADGVGGNKGGAIASRFVSDALANIKEVPDILRMTLIGINAKLIEKANNSPDVSAMATTLTGFYANNGMYQLVHVGNTRAFVRQGRYLKQITSDHTTYNWLRSNGQLEAAESCNKNEITNCFGGADPKLIAKLVICEIAPFSLMMLTSDGVHEYVDLDTLEDILNGEGSYMDKCERIIKKAKENGSEDDKTIVIVVPMEKE